MAEYITTGSQSVALGDNVLFYGTSVPGCSMIHREGSGQFTLRGGKNYLVTFSGNISGATADTEVDLSLAINGEAIPYAKMAATPSAANALNGVSSTIQIKVPKCCCYTLSVKNTGTTAVTVSVGTVVIREV